MPKYAYAFQIIDFLKVNNTLDSSMYKLLQDIHPILGFMLNYA